MIFTYCFLEKGTLRLQDKKLTEVLLPAVARSYWKLLAGTNYCWDFMMS